MIYEWHVVPLIEKYFPSLGVNGLAPDLSSIPGATGEFASAGDNGVEMLILCEVDNG